VERFIFSDLLDEKVQEECRGATILEPQGMDIAIIGTLFNSNGDRVLVYAYEKLIEWFAQEGEGFSSEVLEERYEQAEEWVQYNLIRALPYMGERAPLVAYSLDRSLEEDEEEYCFEGRKWVSDPGYFEEMSQVPAKQ
jgi:hypothetical protein